MVRWGFRIVFSTFLTLCVSGFNSSADNPPKFIENKGQLPENVAFKLRVANADLYFEKDRLTFSFYAPELLHTDHHQQSENAKLGGHAYQMVFVGADGDAKVKPTGRMFPDYSNYITAKYQVGHVRSYDRIRYQNIYKGIDLEYFGRDGHLKYDVIIAPEADVDQLQLQYEGANSLHLKNGRLVVENTYNTVEESIPLAYQIVNGKKIQVACRYKLRGNTVSFVFPDGYDSGYELVIDPTLVFSSYSGSTSDNFGFTATYDHNGSLYGGGIVFGPGYPTTVGAFSSTFVGLPPSTPALNTGDTIVDMAITKFSPDGSTLEYSTYIAGSSAEAPHSMIVNSVGELVILGTTSSPDYPTSGPAYDMSFNGGVPHDYVNNGMNYQNGSDIVVTVLSADGSSLVGSTFLGGSSNDGVNPNGILHYNYNDLFRGEVIVDEDDNIYIVSTTQSMDFPVTTGAYDQTLNGGQDVCLAKFNPNVSVLEWCTYFGGSSADGGYSLKRNSVGEVYITGGTVSADLPMNGSSLHSSYLGGAADGFLASFSADGGTLLASTYLGTSSMDHSYFVEVDNNDDVYAYGQTLGNYPVSSGVYSNTNGKQFIHKLTPDLSTTLFSTVFGSGSATVNISPTAFLVDLCKRIYISGWGGTVNNPNYANAGGYTNGMAVTSDAFQQTTDGSDFYFMVLEADAQSLIYATYFGGAAGLEHVDGGTSRFDSDGVIYQAVCASCGSNNDFPTTAGAWAEQDNSVGWSNYYQQVVSECNLGVIKLAMEIPQVNVGIASTSTVQGCVPFEVEFEAGQIVAPSYMWYFGDGDSSSVANPTHTYTDAGVYEAMLVGVNSNCTGQEFRDTAFTTITAILSLDTVQAGPDQSICPGELAQLNSSGGIQFSWTPSDSLSDATVPDPVASPSETTTYTVSAINSQGCVGVDSVVVEVFTNPLSISNDTTICFGDTITIHGLGGTEYAWGPNTDISDTTSTSPQIYPSIGTTYVLEIIGANSCSWTDSVEVLVQPLPIADAGVDTTVCQGNSVQMDAAGGAYYQWSPATGLNDSTVADPIASPEVTTEYFLTVSDQVGCTDSDTVLVVVFEPNTSADAGSDKYICPGGTTEIGAPAISGFNYLWNPAQTLDDSSQAQPNASPIESTDYIVTVTAFNGCEDFDTVTVTVFNVFAHPDTTVCVNDSVQVFVDGGVSYSWTPTVGVSDPSISDPYITAGDSSVYTVWVTDSIGCQDSATVTIASLDGPVPIFDVEVSQSCFGDSVVFINLSEGIDGYVWNISGEITNELSPSVVFEVGEAPVVTLTVTNNDGECSDSITIDYSNGWFTEDSLAVKYPNVFTPNGDGYNDCFKPDFLGDLDNCYTLKVFSRWGRLLYDSEKMGGNCWDGKQRTDGMVKEGTYYYIANVRGMDHAGFVTVLYPK